MWKHKENCRTENSEKKMIVFLCMTIKLTPIKIEESQFSRFKILIFGLLNFFSTLCSRAPSLLCSESKLSAAGGQQWLGNLPGLRGAVINPGALKLGRKPSTTSNCFLCAFQWDQLLLQQASAPTLYVLFLQTHRVWLWMKWQTWRGNPPEPLQQAVKYT